MNNNNNNELPEPIWVDTPSELDQMVNKLKNFPIIAVDTESNSLHAYREQVCLIQFSTPDGTDYLVDPLAISDLSPLGPIFADPKIEKVFHAAEYDIICLKRDFKFEFANLFDTMMAGRILGRQGVGLAAMLESEFGIELDKTYQRANWAQRPLKPAMLAYARLDTHYLVALQDRLKAELEKKQLMTLAHEDFVRLCATCANNNNDHQEAFWRINGAQDLEPQQVAVLRELVAYREEQAQAINQPPFRILSNQALLEVAQTRPQYIEELRLLPSLTDRNINRHGKSLLKAVRRGLTAPPPKRPANHRMDERAAIRLDMLRNWRKVTGQKMGVESDVILPKEVMYTLAARNPKTLQEVKEVMENLPWRYERFGGEILKIINRI